jgi:hypothetical protein
VPDETEDNATMIGSSPHLTSYDDREEAAAHAGMAGRPDIRSLHVCSECWWFKAGRGEAAEGHCGLYTRRMGGKVGEAIGTAQRACEMWLTNLGDAAWAESRREAPDETNAKREILCAFVP